MTQRVSMLFAFASGLLFAIGLGLGGMLDPAKVVAFLDVGRPTWDPSLAFVMGGAIIVFAPACRALTRRQRTTFGERLNLPTSRVVDTKLVAGAIMFGAGWGLAGYCPGPALVSTVRLQADSAIFVGSMLCAMGLVAVVRGRRESR